MFNNPCLSLVPRSPLILAAMTIALGSTATSAADSPGGFLESVSSTVVRAMPTQTQIRNMLPDRGVFRFPAPYNTQGVRITNAADCGGADCVNDVGYSYWRNTNNHVGQDSMLIFVGLSRSKGGTGPTLFQYNKTTDRITKLGPLFNDSVSYAWHSGEGMYFSATMPNALYVSDSTRIQRYDVKTKTFDTVYDISRSLGGNYHLWQVHSSDDDKVHSATVRDARSGAALGCVAYREDIDRSYYYPRKGAYDECQIDRSGKWLVIKENVDGRNGEDNRIITLATGVERVLLDEKGAGGHSDVGHGYMVATDNWAARANTVKVWRFDTPTLEGKEVFHNSDWGVQAPDHISHTNSLRGVSPSQQFACGSSANRKSVAFANEIFCFTLDGSLKSVVVAPVMTNLSIPLGRNDYTNSPKGNMDVTGKYFIWTSNLGGSRMDAIVVKVPDHLLTGGKVVQPAPTPLPTTPDSIPSKPSGPTDTPDGGAVNQPAILSSLSTKVTSSSAQITWTTNKPTEDQVFFGTTTAYGKSSTLNRTRSTSHSVTLSGLAANTLYHYRVHVRDASGNITSSADKTFRTSASTSVPTPTPSAGNIAWTSIKNSSLSGRVLKKVSGCNGCADAGAISRQSITTTGYLEFKPMLSQGLRYVGLSDASRLNAEAIDFGFGLYGNLVEIRENGVYRRDVYIKSGDVLRVAVNNGKVTYALNGKVFYTSSKKASATLRAAAALYAAGTTVNDAVIGK